MEINITKFFNEDGPFDYSRSMAEAGKDASRAVAKQTYQHQAGLFARVKDDGRADAVNIATWYKQKGCK